MAETLAVVSGGFAVVSLALQLIEAAQRLHTFWNSYEDVGSDVQRIKDHLTTLHAVAATIAETCQQHPQIKCNESVQSSMLACKVSTERLSHLTRNIGNQTRPSRWERGLTKFRATLKDKTVQKIESQLNGDVMMLLLALQPFFQ